MDEDEDADLPRHWTHARRIRKQFRETKAEAEREAAIIRKLGARETELERIERIRDTDIDRYYSENMDARYEQLTSN